MYEARSDASHTMVSATSRGSPKRCSGASAAQPLENLLLALARSRCAGFGELLQPVGCREARTNVVDQDSVFAKLVGQTLDQANHSRPYRIREHKISDRLFRGDRSDGDDAAPAFPLHVGNNFAREINRAEEVQFEGALPFFERGSEKTLGRRASGIGHANIDAAKLRSHGRDEAPDRCRIANVERFDKNFGSVLLSDLLRRGQQSLRVAGAHGDAAALGREGFRRSAANPLTGSSNQSHPIFQAEIHETGIINGAPEPTRLARVLAAN